MTSVTKICLAIDGGSCDDECMNRSTRNRTDALAIGSCGQIARNATERVITMKTMTPKEIALAWGTTPRTLRKFLRSQAEVKGTETPGKGGRWAIEARKVASLKKGFDAWKATQAKEKAERLAKAEAAKATDSPETGDEAPNEDEVTETE